MSAAFLPPPSPRKSLGQHFLRDKRVRERILQAARLCPRDWVLEIGPGDGALTRELLARSARVIALEIDRRMVEHLQARLADFDNLSLIRADALRYDYERLPCAGRPFKVVANLPYYIATALLQRLIAPRQLFSLLVLMLPAEVARRIRALPGGRDYGFLSIFSQVYYQVRPVCRVPPRAFFPPPTIDSLVLCFSRREAPLLRLEDEGFYWRLVRAAFSQRRKTLLNCLRAKLPGDRNELLQALRRAGIEARTRAEQLEPRDFARLAAELRGGCV